MIVKTDRHLAHVKVEILPYIGVRPDQLSSV